MFLQEPHGFSHGEVQWDYSMTGTDKGQFFTGVNVIGRRNRDTGRRQIKSNGK